MGILVILVPLALILGGFFVVLFLWSVRDGQCDDLESPRHRMLLEKENSNE